MFITETARQFKFNDKILYSLPVLNDAALTLIFSNFKLKSDKYIADGKVFSKSPVDILLVHTFSLYLVTSNLL